MTTYIAHLEGFPQPVTFDTRCIEVYGNMGINSLLWIREVEHWGRIQSLTKVAI